MLYLICGTDNKKVETKVSKVVEALVVKKPTAEIFVINEDNFSESYVEELLVSQGLFSNQYLVKCHNLLTDKASSSWVLAKIADIADSSNIFIFKEEAIDKKNFKKLESISIKAWVFNQVDKTDFNDKFIFSIGEAFTARDRKKMWLAVARARSKNMPAEVVFWQIVNSVRNINFLLLGGDLAELKLHPFVISKTKKEAQNFTLVEIQDFLNQLFVLYYDSRRGGLDLYDRLERFSLGV